MQTEKKKKEEHQNDTKRLYRGVLVRTLKMRSFGAWPSAPSAPALFFATATATLARIFSLNFEKLSPSRHADTLRFSATAVPFGGVITAGDATVAAGAAAVVVVGAVDSSFGSFGAVDAVSAWEAAAVAVAETVIGSVGA